MARRPVGFAKGGRGRREKRRGRNGEVGKSNAEGRVSGGARGKNAERMREIRIYTIVQRSMPSMRLVFNALINV